MNLNKKFYIIIILFLGLASLSMLLLAEKENRNIKIINISKKAPIQSSNNLKRFYDNYNLSIKFNHHNMRLINDEFVVSALSTDHSRLYIYNTETDSLLDLNMRNGNIPKLPILSIYIHSYDSIFMLFDNSTTLPDSINMDKGKTELILFNDKLVAKKRFNLNKIPYLFSRSDKSTIENNILNYQNKIIGSKLIFPVAIYSPGTDEESFKDFHPNQIYLLDLLDGNIKELNVKFPTNDIGKEFEKKILTNVIQYYCISSDSIVFSYPHSPTLYILDLLKNKSEVLKEFNNFPFENIPVDGEKEVDRRFSFETLVYSKKQNVYFRKINILEYKQYKSTTIIQVVDRNFNHIGFIKDKKNDTYITCFGNEPFILDKELIPFELGDINTYNLSQFEKLYLLPKNLESKTSSIKDVERIPFEFRMLDYLKKIGIDDANKVIVINTDMMCSSCIDYLMNTLKENQNYYKEKNIHYLFIGKDISTGVALIMNYNVKTNIEFDIDCEFSKYFIDSEIINYLLIDNSNNKLQIESATFNELHTKIPDFLNLPR